MTNLHSLIRKIKNGLWYKVIHYTRNGFAYPYLYRSYWHSISRRSNMDTPFANTLYYAARPNPGAGIGHQMANWIAGRWYAQLFNLNFAHLPFSSAHWEKFLGFGIGEITVEELKRKGYKTRKLPLFDERSESEINLNRKIIQSYTGKKVVFIAEQDQGYQAQYKMMDLLKKKFNSASTQREEQLTYQKQHFNIAIHVRRGDIMVNTERNPNLLMRYQSNHYFDKVLRQITANLQTNKPIHIYLFSQGKAEDYPEFDSFENLHWCMNMPAQDSFLHMVYADLLITSKSSFSYKPALLNNGIKVCPENFWHDYPNTNDWVLCDDDGNINSNQLYKLL